MMILNCIYDMFSFRSNVSVCNVMNMSNYVLYLQGYLYYVVHFHVRIILHKILNSHFLKMVNHIS